MFGTRPISTRCVGQVGFDQKGDKQVASIMAAVSLSAFGMHGLPRSSFSGVVRNYQLVYQALLAGLVQRVEQFLLGVDAKLRVHIARIAFHGVFR